MREEFLNKARKILKDCEGGIIFSLTEEERNEMIKLIDLDEYKHEFELRILRNYLVLIISNDNIQTTDNSSRIIENQKIMTVVTNLIDDKIFKLGGQV